MEENFLRIIGISRKDPRDKFTETDPIIVIPWRRIFLMKKCRWKKRKSLVHEKISSGDMELLINTNDTRGKTQKMPTDCFTTGNP